MTYEEKVQWCIEQHRNTNHFYDKYLPYEFHLRMVVQVYIDFKHLLNGYNEAWVDDVEIACWGHDLIEDTRTSYNDVANKFGVPVANLIFALTNDKGKNRHERAGLKYYEGIRKVIGADFVKLCDRIANVQYSKMSRSSMFEMYKKENEGFIAQIGNSYPEMNNYLINLFAP